MSFKILKYLCLGLLVVSFSCDTKQEPLIQPGSGKIILEFTHKVDGNALEKSIMKYVNKAGNLYQIDEVMYFISDVKLYGEDGKIVTINKWKDIHYIDINIPSTLKWEVFDDIPEGTYNSISFTFGLSETKNKTGLFVNYPEVNMAWPEILGGGYHYLMINGKWKDTAQIIRNYNFHLGIGQIYKNGIINTDSIIGYVHNYFIVNLNNLSIKIEKDRKTSVEIIMNIESWFETPHIYDHNKWGGDIMQKQEALNIAKENGYDVFSVGNVTTY